MRGFLSTLRRIFIGHNILKFFLIGLLLMTISTGIARYFYPWEILLLPIFILPMYIMNILVNFEDLNLIDVNYVRMLHPTLVETLLFIILGSSCFTITALMHGFEKYRRIIYFIYLALFGRLIIHEIILWLPPSFPLVPSGGVIDYFELAIFLRIFISSLSIIIIIFAIIGRLDVIYISDYIIRYIFTIGELLLTLYVGIAFIGWRAGPDVNYDNLILAKVSIIPLGFILFVILELIRRFSRDYLRSIDSKR